MLFVSDCIVGPCDLLARVVFPAKYLGEQCDDLMIRSM